jgi:hypothetical protein
MFAENEASEVISTMLAEVWLAGSMPRRAA